MSVLKSDLEKAFDIQVDNLYYIYADILNEIFGKQLEMGKIGSDYLDEVVKKYGISVGKETNLLEGGGNIKDLMKYCKK